MGSSTISGGNYTGGFSIGGNVVIEGCVFNGKINGSSQSGGFVGYSHSKLKITNSLFAPKDGSSISGGTFYFNGGGDITPTNSYYTTALGTAQGKRLRGITAGENVTISSTEPEPVVSNDSKVTFVGQYSLFAIDETNINSVIMLSSGNRLGYSNATRTLRPFRAHFEVPGENPVRNFVLDFDGETTSMHNAECIMHNGADAWYSLDGRKLDNVPTKKGLYIHGGKKVAIK